MNQTLAIDLSEETIQLLSDQASAVGQTATEFAANVVENSVAGHPASQTNSPHAREAFEACFGSVDLGHPLGLDNKAIDEDLGRAYGDSRNSGNGQ